jgi:hypothetical protein
VRRDVIDQFDLAPLEQIARALPDPAGAPSQPQADASERKDGYFGALGALTVLRAHTYRRRRHRGPAA